MAIIVDQSRIGLEGNHSNYDASLGTSQNKNRFLDSFVTVAGSGLALFAGVVRYSAGSSRSGGWRHTKVTFNFGLKSLLVTGVINLAYAVRRARGEEDWQGLLFFLGFPWSIGSWALIENGSHNILGWKLDDVTNVKKMVE